MCLHCLHKYVDCLLAVFYVFIVQGDFIYPILETEVHIFGSPRSEAKCCIFKELLEKSHAFKKCAVYSEIYGLGSGK